MWYPLVGFLLVVTLFSFPIGNHLNTAKAQEIVEPCSECETTTDVYDCFDDGICTSYDDCFDCCKRNGWSTYNCNRECRNTWPQIRVPTTSDAGKVIVALLLIASTIYLLRKRTGFARG